MARAIASGDAVVIRSRFSELASQGYPSRRFAPALDARGRVSLARADSDPCTPPRGLKRESPAALSWESPAHRDRSLAFPRSGRSLAPGYPAGAPVPEGPHARKARMLMCNCFPILGDNFLLIQASLLVFVSAQGRPIHMKLCNSIYLAWALSPASPSASYLLKSQLTGGGGGSNWHLMKWECQPLTPQPSPLPAPPHRADDPSTISSHDRVLTGRSRRSRGVWTAGSKTGSTHKVVRVGRSREGAHRRSHQEEEGMEAQIGMCVVSAILLFLTFA
jgi:hypothetical protein